MRYGVSGSESTSLWKSMVLVVVGFIGGCITPVFQAPMRDLGDWIFPPEPELRFQVIRQSEGQLTAFVVNQGSSSAVIYHLQVCAPNDGYILNVEGDGRIELWNRTPDLTDSLMVGDLLRHPVGGWKTYCRSDFQSLRVIGGDRNVPSGGQTELDLDAPEGFELFSLVDKAPILISSYCTAVLVSDHRRVHTLVACRAAGGSQ